MTAQRLHTAAGHAGHHIARQLFQQGRRVQSITGHPGRYNPFGDRAPRQPLNSDRTDPQRRAPEPANPAKWLDRPEAGPGAKHRQHGQATGSTREEGGKKPRDNPG